MADEIIEMADKLTPPIARLPVETMTQIASYLSINEVFSLRLTSKAVSALSMDFFLRKFFAAKQLWMHEASLQALVDMSANPSIAGAMQHVALGSDHLHQPPMSAHSNPCWITSAQIHYMHEYKAAQTHLHTSGAAVAMLTKAFKNLKKLETVSIRDFDKSPRSLASQHASKIKTGFWEDVQPMSSYGAKTISQESGLFISPDSIEGSSYKSQSIGVNTQTIGHWFVEVPTALSNANAHTKAIEVIVRDSYWALIDQAFYVPATLQLSLKHMLSKLTRFHLDLRLGTDQQWEARDSLERVQDRTGANEVNFSPLLQKFLYLTPNLTCLRLGFAGSEPYATDQFLRWLAGDDPDNAFRDGPQFPNPVKLGHLDHLELNGNMHAKSLRSLIRSYSSTLTKLSLRGVGLITLDIPTSLSSATAVWSNFLEFLGHDAPKLRHFRMSCARATGQESIPFSDMYDFGKSQEILPDIDMDWAHEPDNMKHYLKNLAWRVANRDWQGIMRPRPDMDDDDDEYESNDEEEEEEEEEYVGYGDEASDDDEEDEEYYGYDDYGEMPDRNDADWLDF